MEFGADLLPAVDNRAKRLSKPRTNTSSSNLLALKDLQTNPAPSVATSEDSRSSEEQRHTRYDGERRRTRRKSMIRIASFFKNHSTEEDEGSDYETPSLISTEDSPNSKKRSSTAPIVSSVSQLPGSRPSTADLLTQSNLSLSDEESVRLLDEIKIKEKALADTRAALTHMPSPVDEDKHPDSVMSPIRRKSLYTPGIATRTPHDILRKPPPPPQIEKQVDRDYYYNPLYSETSPLAFLASLELPPNGRSTPCDLDRTHLGGLSLGTLRVTNGAASPEPGSESSNLRPLSSIRSEDDYYTASEGVRSDNENTIPQAETRARNCIQRTSERSGSPLRHQHRLLEEEGEIMCSNFEKAQPLGCEPISLIRGYDPVQDDSASVIAQDYISEIPDSPFKYPSSDAPVTKHERDNEVPQSDNGNVKHCYDDTTDSTFATSLHGASSPRKNGDTVLERSTPSVAYERLNGRATRDPEFILRPVSTLTAFSKSTDSEGSNTQSTVASFGDNTDSGYVSDVAGRPVTRSTRDFDEDIKARLFSNPLPDHDFRNNLDKPHDSLREARPVCPDRSLTAPQMPLNWRRSKSRSRTGDPLPGAVPVRPQSRSSSSSWRLSLPALSVSRKLQKARRSSQPPPAEGLLARDLSQSQLPLVPPELVTRMSERALDFPLLQRTFTSPNQGISTTSSHQQLAAAPVRFPSVTSQVEEQLEIDERIDAICRSNLDWPNKKSNKKKGDAKKKKADAVAEKERKKGKLSKMKRPPSEAETMATIADFGTVTESLGRSPYDIAMATAHPRARSRSPIGNLQPYSMSTSMPRVKRTVGMNDEEAAEFARFNNERYRRRSSSFGKPDSLALAKADDTASTPKRKPRPKSMYADVPPMPCVPLTSVPKERELSADLIARPQDCESFQDWPERKARSQDVAVGYDAVAKSEVSQGPVIAARRSSSRIKALTARPRPRSMYADVPPVPAVPAPTLDKNRGMRVVQTNTLMPPRQEEAETNDTAPELRSSAPPESSPSIKEGHQQSPWAASRSAWSQRRKSAGEALLKQQMVVFRNQSHQEEQPAQSMAVPSQVTPARHSIHQPLQTRSLADTLVQHQQHILTQQGGQATSWRPDLAESPPFYQDGQQQQRPQPVERIAQQGPEASPFVSSEDHRSGDDMPVQYPSYDHCQADCEQQSSPIYHGPQNTATRPRQDLCTLPSFRPPPPPSQIPTPTSFSIPRKRVVSHVTAFEALHTSPPSTSSPINAPHEISTTAPTPPPKDDSPGYYHPTTGRFTGLSGRYEGGLMYGYEPGFGLGGSAGTRTPKTGATRKSLGVASAFGVDLSDVPVFVGRI